MSKHQKSCIDCGQLNCKYQNKKYPNFCITTNLSESDIVEVKKLYQEPENQEVAKISAEIEAEFYGKYTRVEEIIEFARR